MKAGAAAIQVRPTPSGCTWVKSPVSGQVVAGAKEAVKVGDDVTAGGPVLVLNAMKMEFVVKSPSSGTVVEIAALPDQQIEEGEQVVLLREAESSGESSLAFTQAQQERFQIRQARQQT